MPLQQHQVEEIARIMGISKDMLDLLPKLVSPDHAMNPWVKQLPGVFSQLDLKPGQTILDIPCGTGRVSVPLAKTYQTRILGFDILPAYIESAQAFAQLHQVDEQCDFSVADIRSVIERRDICDLLLWIAPPHIWQSPRETVAHLRNPVKPDGHILIGDAYLKGEAARAVYPEFEPFEESTNGYLACGDELVLRLDYQDTLWDADYHRTREAALTALTQSADEKERQLIQRYLDGLTEDEINDKTHLGSAIWVLKVKK